MTRARSTVCPVLVVALVALAPACSKPQEEQEVLTTTLFDPREGAAHEERPPPRLVGEKGAAGARPGLIVLRDRRCTDRRCDTAPLIARLKAALPGLQVTIHDWSDERCRQLLDGHGLRHLPAYLLDEVATRQPGFKAVAPHAGKTPKGKMHYLRIKASFDPRAEVCDNGVDDTGNGRVDCDDSDCTGKPVCRPDLPRRLDLFVMSHCPHGIKALNAMSEVLDALGPGIDFRVHYIADTAGDGFSSLHGQPEVEEDIRGLCAMRHFGRGRRYMHYIWCRNRKIDQDWQRCVGRRGISKAVIERCSTGDEGRQLLREDLKLARELGITSSPTWLANNRFVFHGNTPEAIGQAFCGRNKGLRGCDRPLSKTAPAPGD